MMNIIHALASSFPPPAHIDCSDFYAHFNLSDNDLKKVPQLRHNLKSPIDPSLQIKKLQKKLQEGQFLFIGKSGKWPGEYVAQSEEYLYWLTGFDGSAGSCIISQDRAILFTDSRYTLQAQKQSPQMEQICTDQLSPIAWLKDNSNENHSLLFNAHYLPIAYFKQMGTQLKLQLQPLHEWSLLDDLWPDQIPYPMGIVWHHKLKYAGLKPQDKIQYYQTALMQNHLDGYIITQPENIAWLLNIRGCDIAHTPIPLTFAVIWKNGTVDWYIDYRRLTKEVIHLLSDFTSFHMPSALYEYDFSKKKIGYHQATTTVAITHLIGDQAQPLTDPALLPKAKKNHKEKIGIQKAHLIDAAVMMRFLHWLEVNIPKNHVTELMAAQKLDHMRLENPLCTSPSFETISASGPNAALPHYRVTKESDRQLSADEIYLVDSGGQYKMGTTDITRTIKINPATQEEKTAFTLVLKGVIQLFKAQFSPTTTGDKLDHIARKPLSDHGLSFGHGTGHGVGCYLGVHEGPQSLSPHNTTIPIEPDMLCSIEPGYYKDGHFGIRIENLALVQSIYEKRFFMNLTLCPIDTRLIERSLLTQIEWDWLNHYHKQVREKLTPLLHSHREACRWLYEVTKIIE